MKTRQKTMLRNFAISVALEIMGIKAATVIVNKGMQSITKASQESIQRMKAKQLGHSPAGKE